MNRDFIEKELASLKEFYDLPPHHLFAMWVVGLFHFKAEFNDSTISDIHEHSQSLLSCGDQQLDGYFYEEDANELFLYQMKWPDLEKKSSVTDAKEVAHGLTQLQNDISALKGIDSARAEAARALESVVKSKGRIILRAVTGTKWQGAYKDDVLKCVPSTLRPLVQIDLIDLSGLKEVIGQQSEDLAGRRIEFVVFDGTNDPILEVPGQNKGGLGDAIVVLLSGKSLAEQARKNGTRLFERNVRLFMSSSKPVNKDMLEALGSNDHRRKFWYGHNGITILCDGLARSEKNGRVSAVTLLNPQIVNGCQTANTLAEGMLSDDGKSDIPLLARIIQLVGTAEEKADAAELIAYGTNNQSAVHDADLRANDQAQRYFQRLLRDVRPPWFYERKTAEWKNLCKRRAEAAKYKERKKADRVINRDEYQQAWRSYTGDPYGAIAKKNAVWERSHGKGAGDLYKQVFDYNRRAIDVILPVTLFDWFSKVFALKTGNALCVDVNKNLKAHIDQLSAGKMLVSAHSVALFGHLVTTAYGSVEGFPEKKALEIVSKLDRKSKVASNWQGKASWAVIRKPAEEIMKAWGTYALLVQRKPEATIYRELKSENALNDLIDILNNQLSNLEQQEWSKLFD